MAEELRFQKLTWKRGAVDIARNDGDSRRRRQYLDSRPPCSQLLRLQLLRAACVDMARWRTERTGCLCWRIQQLHERYRPAAPKAGAVQSRHHFGSEGPFH